MRGSKQNGIKHSPSLTSSCFFVKAILICYRSFQILCGDIVLYQPPTEHGSSSLCYY